MDIQTIEKVCLHADNTRTPHINSRQFLNTFFLKKIYNTVWYKIQHKEKPSCRLMTR